MSVRPAESGPSGIHTALGVGVCVCVCVAHSGPRGGGNRAGRAEWPARCLALPLRD